MFFDRFYRFYDVSYIIWAGNAPKILKKINNMHIVFCLLIFDRFYDVFIVFFRFYDVNYIIWAGNAPKNIEKIREIILLNFGFKILPLDVTVYH